MTTVGGAPKSASAAAFLARPRRAPRPKEAPPPRSETKDGGAAKDLPAG